MINKDNTGALSGSRASVEPVARLDPAGFDPARVEFYSRKITAAQLRNLCALPSAPDVWMTVSEMRGKGATGSGMDLLYVYHLDHTIRVCERRFVRWGGERGQKRGEGYEYSITPFGIAVRAQAIAGEAQRGETVEQGSTGTASTRAEGIAQTPLSRNYP